MEVIPSFANLSELFRLSIPLWELVIRGSAMYWFLILLFRFIARRDLGSMSVPDVLILVIIADAAQNGMSGGYESITDGFILVGVLLGWNCALDRLAYRFPIFRRLVEPPPTLLVLNGQMQRRTMVAEAITEEELKSQLREAGIDDVKSVQKMCLEPDGKLSVIRKNS